MWQPLAKVCINSTISPYMCASGNIDTILPILHDFKPDNIHHLVNHSESRLFFADAATWDNLAPDTMGKLDGAVLINDYSLLLSRNKRKVRPSMQNWRLLHRLP